MLNRKSGAGEVFMKRHVFMYFIYYVIVSPLVVRSGGAYPERLGG